MTEGHYSPFSAEELSKMDIKDRVAATEIRLDSMTKFTQRVLRFNKEITD